jgi:NAD(P)H dehydrogenase (quinone)
MIAVTGANGQLGQLVIEGLVERVPANQLIAAVRRPEKASSFRTLGVQVREADYRRPETLSAAFQGVQRVLLISVDEVNQRFKLHKAVVDAAKEAGVELLVYTSVLHADSSELFLAREHKQTEDYIRASGLPFVILRNGWYLENHTSALAVLWRAVHSRELQQRPVRISIARRLCRSGGCRPHPPRFAKQDIRTGRRPILFDG